MAKLYEIRDPVHNFILFNGFERRLIDSQPVQRLKHIKQLALTYEVYPGGTYSRFEHSLGTMELATQAFNTILLKDPAALRELGWSELDKGRIVSYFELALFYMTSGMPPFPTHRKTCYLRAIGVTRASRKH